MSDMVWNGSVWLGVLTIILARSTGCSMLRIPHKRALLGRSGYYSSMSHLSNQGASIRWIQKHSLLITAACLCLPNVQVPHTVYVHGVQVRSAGNPRPRRRAHHFFEMWQRRFRPGYEKLVRLGRIRGAPISALTESNSCAWPHNRFVVDIPHRTVKRREDRFARGVGVAPFNGGRGTWDIGLGADGHGRCSTPCSVYL
jgi:hypothetical protein